MRALVIIPALKPDNRLCQLIQNIKESQNFNLDVLVVNDGSPKSYQPIFTSLKKEWQIPILTHPSNLGKGQAIKTALTWLLQEHETYEVAITADADGQHRLEDIEKCLVAWQNNSDAIIFGSRNFSQDIPLRSKFGNITTSLLLRGVTGTSIQDTQTGLRAIPAQYFKAFSAITGDRFNYEMNTILYCVNQQIPIVEVPIATIYLNDNASSHFRLLHDSFSIYGSFLKLAGLKILRYGLDFSLFLLLLQTLSTNPLVLAFIFLLSRSLADLATLPLRKKALAALSPSQPLLRRSLLTRALLNMILTLLFTLLQSQLPYGPLAIKIGVESLCFLLSIILPRKYRFYT